MFRLQQIINLKNEGGSSSTSKPSSVMLSFGTNSPALLMRMCSGRFRLRNSSAKLFTDLATRMYTFGVVRRRSL